MTTPTRLGAGLNRPLSNNPNLNQKKSRHLIDDISFSLNFIVCTCAWKGAIDAYQPHRKEMEPSVPNPTEKELVK